jgi:hypothetical protein
MFTKSDIRTSKRSLAVLLLPLFALLIIACDAPADGEWVVHELDTSEQPETIYYILNTKMQPGYTEEDDQYGDATDCQLLPLNKQSTTDPHGKHHYSAMGPLDAFWQQCNKFNAADKPPLVINSIPPEFAEQMGVEIPDFFIKN